VLLAKGPPAEYMDGDSRSRRVYFGESPVNSTDDGTQLHWATLMQYARAAKEFSSPQPGFQPSAAFARLIAVDLGSQPAVQTIECSDGARLAFRHYALRADAGPAIVLLHGSAGHAGQMHGLAQGIVERGLGEVYALDMRGHGASSGKRGHAVERNDRLCADIGEFLAYVEQQRPSAPIVLGGHSAGGGLVLRFCRSRQGRRVSACFFMAPYLGLGSPTIRPLFGGWVKVRSSRLRALALANVLGISQFNEMTVIEFNLGALANDPAYAPSWSFNTMLAFGSGLWSATAPAIDAAIPVLSIGGDRDECFLAERYPDAFRIVAPQAEVRTARDCGHWDVLVDEAVLETLAEWLRRPVRTHGSR